MTFKLKFQPDFIPLRVKKLVKEQLALECPKMPKMTKNMINFIPNKLNQSYILILLCNVSYLSVTDRQTVNLLDLKELLYDA